ncbi:MAG: hypothetical protein ACE5PM_00170 [Candidatus Hydrothermarchaeales archaeon]
MVEKIYLWDFPEFMRLEVTNDFREEIFVEAMERVGTLYVDKAELIDVSEGSGQPIYEFIFGEMEGKIIEVLEGGPRSSVELIQETGLAEGTFYHKISDMKKRGIIEREDRRYGLKNPLQVRFSELKGNRSLAPKLRRKNSVSKDEVILALYLWPKYRDACAKEGVDLQNPKYATTYRDIFSLAHAIKMWRGGRSNIPKWALIAIAGLAGKGHRLNGEAVIESYTLPPGIKVVPFYDGIYKIPIEVDVKLDKIAIQLWAKGSNDGRAYNHKNRGEFFESLYRVFGTFKAKGGRVPLPLVEIMKKHYSIGHFDKYGAKVPRRIIDKIKALKDPERVNYEVALLEGILELGSYHREDRELTSRSEEFLSNTSKLLENLGIGKVTVRKKKGRPHYRCTISSSKSALMRRRKRDLEELYAGIGETYPDFEVWNRIPLNNISEKVRKRDLSRPLKALQEICKEELFNYLGSILKSIERNMPEYGRDYFEREDQLRLTEHFWNLKKIPNLRNVKEYLSELEKSWFVQKSTISALSE